MVKDIKLRNLLRRGLPNLETVSSLNIERVDVYKRSKRVCSLYPWGALSPQDRAQIGVDKKTDKNSTLLVKATEFKNNLPIYLAMVDSGKNIIVKSQGQTVSFLVRKDIIENCLSKVVTIPLGDLPRVIISDFSTQCCYIKDGDNVWFFFKTLLYEYSPTLFYKNKLKSSLNIDKILANATLIEATNLGGIHLNTETVYCVTNKNKVVGFIIQAKEIMQNLAPEERIIQNLNKRSFQIEYNKIYKSKTIAFSRLTQQVGFITKYRKPVYAILSYNYYDKIFSTEIAKDTDIPSLKYKNLFENFEKDTSEVAKAVGKGFNIYDVVIVKGDRLKDVMAHLKFSSEE